MNKLLIPETVSFEEAIALTEELLSLMETDRLSEPEIQELITDLVKSENGARGFFVAYLTDERSFADEPSPAVFQALETSPEIVPELLVKNVAMSAAMEVHHRRNEDEEMAASSGRVRSRSVHLIENVNLPALETIVKDIYESAVTGGGVYQEFLKRWGYDGEQRDAIARSLQPLI